MGILKKSKATSVEKMDLLLSNFAGEQVEIVVDRDLETPVGTQDGGFELINIPLTIQGYLTDHDDKFIYLGLSVNQINQCVQKDYVVHIGVVDENEISMDEEGKTPAGKFN